MCDDSWYADDDAASNSANNHYSQRDNDRRSDSYNSRTFHSRSRQSHHSRDRHSATSLNSASAPVEILIPSQYVGRVIGRGGSKINELQFETQAKINVTKRTENDQTVIELSGSKEAIEKAQELISDLTKERAPRAPPLVLETVPQKSHDFNAARDRSPPKVDWKTFMAQCDTHEKEHWAKFPLIQKEFYKEHPQVTAMSQQEVDAFRVANNNIIVDRTFKTDNSKAIPKPTPAFLQAFHNYPEILDEISKVGFERPTPIQAQAWPVLLSGEDLIGIAQTGTGKTLAFLLPALIHIDGQLTKRSERTGPAVLIMAPTRELALQIEKESKKYHYRGITAVCLYGGGNRKEQIDVLQSGIDIVIATPGRLNDLVLAGHMTVDYVTYVVLDEADRMLDMGFEPQIRKVMYSIRPTRQTVMTSATWPPGVRRLAQSYMSDPIQVYIGTLDLAATHTVTQRIEMLESSDDDYKFNFFMEFARNLSPEDKIIVFCGKKARADYLSSELILAGLAVQSIHGDREQSDREQALRDIADGTVNILIATDVASRGLDIDDITHVINFDFPRNIEEYVHRVGRTGRAGKTGESISYLTKQDWAQARELIKILEKGQQYVPPELFGMADRYEAWKERKDAERPAYGGRSRFGGGGGGGGRSGNRW